MSATESSTTSSSNAILVFANRTNDNNIIIIAHVLCFDNDRAVHMKRRAALAASTLE